MTDTIIIDIPATFASDHYDRDLPSGTIVRQGDRVWRFRCTVEELNEWLSDAEYYSDCAGQGWCLGTRGEALGLQSSARATAKRIRAALIAIAEAQRLARADVFDTEYAPEVI